MRHESDSSVLMLELNEFSRELLADASRALGLMNIQRLLAFPESTTFTGDTYDSNYLEPWVQWVSVHTGTPSATHKIKHLGDVPQLETPQIWESLSQGGVTCGVWGAMNASRGNAEKCLFFLPDPWTFSEPGYPAELNQLLELPRYLAKNYLNISKLQTVSKFFSFLALFCFSRSFWTLLRELPALVWNLARFKGEHFAVISFTDFVLTDLFLEYRRKFSPRFTILFVNGLAHLQHHHWHGSDYRHNKRLTVGLRYIDRMLAKIFAALSEKDVFICLNGLSQTNTNQDKPWVLYRQFDQGKFLGLTGVPVARVEPHMTHDAHLFFQTEERCSNARAVLDSATVNGQRLFLIETYQDDKRKLFYRIDFTDPLPPDSVLKVAGKDYRFSDFFEAVVTRTGKHIPQGTVFSNAPGMPVSLPNHGVYHYLLKFFGIGNLKPHVSDA